MALVTRYGGKSKNTVRFRQGNGPDGKPLPEVVWRRGEFIEINSSEKGGDSYRVTFARDKGKVVHQELFKTWADVAALFSWLGWEEVEREE